MGLTTRREFPDPFRFDVGRDPNRRLAFGHGPHKRLGAHFAASDWRSSQRSSSSACRRSRSTAPVRCLMSNIISGVNHLPPRWPAA
jgi:cytochrome P450